jgi:hypothetical protein
LGKKDRKRFAKLMAPKTGRILTSDKVDFKPILVRKENKGHFILMKGAIH